MLWRTTFVTVYLDGQEAKRKAKGKSGRSEEAAGEPSRESDTCSDADMEGVKDNLAFLCFDIFV